METTVKIVVAKILFFMLTSFVVTLSRLKKQKFLYTQSPPAVKIASFHIF